MVLSPAATTHRLQRLQDRGLVTRSAHPDDARHGVVALTDAGRVLVDEAVTDHVATLDALLAGLTPGERDRLAALLAAVEEGAGR